MVTFLDACEHPGIEEEEQSAYDQTPDFDKSRYPCSDRPLLILSCVDVDNSRHSSSEPINRGRQKYAMANPDVIRTPANPKYHHAERSYHTTDARHNQQWQVADVGHNPPLSITSISFGISSAEGVLDGCKGSGEDDEPSKEKPGKDSNGDIVPFWYGVYLK